MYWLQFCSPGAGQTGDWQPTVTTGSRDPGRMSIWLAGRYDGSVLLSLQLLADESLIVH
jgi:hypothetical protein